MNRIEDQAVFYRAYLPDDRSFVSLAVLLSTMVALWLLVYLVSVAADAAPENARLTFDQPKQMRIVSPTRVSSFGPHVRVLSHDQVENARQRETLPTRGRSHLAPPAPSAHTRFSGVLRR